MTLTTGITWLDRELQTSSAAYIRVESQKLRSRILKQCIATNIDRKNIAALSFSQPRNSYWSFDIEQILADSIDTVATDRLTEQLTLERIGRYGTPDTSSWDQLHNAAPDLVVADRVTNLRVDSLHGDITPLEKAAQQLGRFPDTTDLIVLDSNAPYRPLTNLIDTTIRLSPGDSLLEAQITRDGLDEPKEKIVGIDSQKTLEEFRALAT